MKSDLIRLSSVLILGFCAAPAWVWADANPDFDDDAKPILRQQPGLLHYVESRFEVKDTGTAKYPGDDDRHPIPPYIFRARPLGSNGPFNLRLLIQPGAPGHILNVVDITRVHLTEPGQPHRSQPPAVAYQPPVQRQPQAQPAPSPNFDGPVKQPGSQPTQAQAPSPQPTEPTADTPSGPITAPISNSTQPNLAPPPDPAPNSN